MQNAHEPGYSESESLAEEEILLVGGGGDLRYTLRLHPVVSLSDSNWLTRSIEGFALNRSSSSKQRGDLEAIVAFSATVGPQALIEVLPRGGGGDLRYTLDSRPVTSLSDSNQLEERAHTVIAAHAARQAAHTPSCIEYVTVE